MSSPTWTVAVPSFEPRPYREEVWRVVESQNKSSTVRLTEDLDDQALLEELIDEVKPGFPADCRDLNFLLATPFRYAPYPNASRFRRANSYPGVFYAAEHPMTAMTELAFYRMLFFHEAPGMVLPSRPVEHRVFSVLCETARSLDLTQPPLSEAGDWTHPTDYAACHDLADRARDEGIAVIRYQSVRDPLGRCVALLAPSAFAETEPRRLETWHVFTRPAKVQVWREFPPLQREFDLAEFDADPRVRDLLAPKEQAKGEPSDLPATPDPTAE